MKLPKPGAEIVFAHDKYRNRVLLHGNTCEGDDGYVGFDLQTDGRILLTPQVARDLSTKLLKFAKAAEQRQGKKRNS